MSFISNENIEILWDVILDERIIQTNNVFELSQTKKYFVNQLLLFNDREKNTSPKKDLITMNKTFISSIIQTFANAITNEVVDSQKERKIQFHEKEQRQEEKQEQTANYFEKSNDENTDLWTNEAFRKEKRNKFDMELAEKQKEFEFSISRPIPEIPNFSDNVKEKPISEMEKMIAQTIAERNNDMENIYKMFNGPDGTNGPQGPQGSKDSQINIQSMERISKQEPIIKIKPPRPLPPSLQIQPIKYIKIGDEIDTSIPIPVPIPIPIPISIIDIDHSDITNDNPPLETKSIFQKLKLREITPANEENTYSQEITELKNLLHTYSQEIIEMKNRVKKLEEEQEKMKERMNNVDD